MRTLGFVLVAVVALTAQATAQSSSSAPALTLVYQFGYNTPVANAGDGTGHTTINVYGVQPDGGVLISGQDYWWNTARPRAVNSCEVYSNGKVNCGERPYAISPIQLTIFPLLASKYFNAMGAGGTGNWTHNFTIYAAILPGGASSFANSPTTWKTTYALTGKGPIPNGGNAVLVTANGTLAQQGGAYFSMKSKERIAYDTVLKVPVAVSDVRTHYPQRNVYNNDVIELKLTKDSHAALHNAVSPP